MIDSEMTKSAAWVTLGRLIALFGGFLALMVLARVLSPDDFGLFGLAMIIIQIPEGLFGGRLQEILIQKRDTEQRHISTMFTVSVLLALASFLLVNLAAPYLTRLFSAPGLKDILFIMSFILLMHAASSVAAALMIRKMAFQKITIIDIVSSVTAALVGVTIALRYHSVWALVWMEMTRRIIRMTMFLMFSRLKFDFRYYSDAASEMFDYSRKAVAAGGARTIERILPGMLIGYGLGTVALGYYNVALRLLENAFAVLVDPLSHVSFPVFANAQAELGTVRKQLENAVYLAAIVAAPAFGGGIIAAPALVPVLFGDQWLPVIPLVQLSFMSGIVLTIAGINYALLNAIGYPGIVLRINVLTTVATFIGVVCVLNISLEAVMLIILIKTILMWALTAREVKVYAGQNYRNQLRPMMVPMLATLMMMAGTQAFYIAWGAQMPNLASLLATIGIGVILYPSALFAIKPSLLGMAKEQIETKVLSRFK